IQVGMIPQPGTDLTKAIRLGAGMLRRHPGHKALVLLTDGEDTVGKPQEAAVEAAELGIHLYLIGTGTPEGEPIPLRDSSGALTGYKKDAAGQTVLTRLGESSLRSLAAAGGGAYFRATPSEGEVLEILRQIEGLEKGGSSTGSATRFRNRYRLPLALAFLLLLVELLVVETGPRPAGPAQALAGRKGGTRAAPAADEKNGERQTEEGKREASLLLILALPFSFGGCNPRSDARLWKGNKEYRSKNFGKALEHYARAAGRADKDPKPLFNAGDALYKLGELGKAEEAFSRLADPKKVPRKTAAASYHNLGNALLGQERPKEAAEAYRRCLLLEPGDEDCRHNLALALRPPKERKDKKGGDGDKKDEDKKGQPPPSPPKQKSSSTDKKEQKQSAGMSQEDAERILQAVKEKEKTAPPMPMSPQGDKKPQRTEKDW
ncbi:MAG: tetratricopeptide repeat protein, partial [Elusimicrobiota bacterium]